MSICLLNQDEKPETSSKGGGNCPGCGEWFWGDIIEPHPLPASQDPQECLGTGQLLSNQS